MNDAPLYAKSNSFQRTATKDILQEFIHLLQWRNNGGDSILDIGCGTGDTIIASILPSIPSNFCRLVGCDISSKMIYYARKHHDHPKVIYERLDIGGNVDEFLAENGPFNHVVSFFCLHWVQNQWSAMRNISKLLSATGDCLLLIIISSSIFTIYHDMMKSTKWSKYMQDVRDFVSPYYYSLHPIDDLRERLLAAGFTKCDLRTRQLKYLYNNLDEVISKLE